MSKRNTVKLGTETEILSGFPFKSENFNDSEGTPIVRIRDVVPGYSGTKYRGKFDPEYIVNNGDILIGMDGEFNTARWGGGPALLNQRVCRIKPRNGKLDEGYLYRFLPKVLKQIEEATPFVTVKHLSVKTLREIDLPLPPLLQQRRIAEVLDKAEALRAHRRKTLGEIDEFPQAIFSHLFGYPDALLSKWPTKKLGDLLDFLTSGSRGWATHYSESGSLFLRIQNVRNDELLLDDVAYVNAPETAEAKRTRVEPGDVLLSITADLGRTAVIQEGLGQAFINQHLSILRTKSILPRFLSSFLASPLGQSQIHRRNKHAVKAGLNFDDIRSFSVPTPPPELQEQFVNRIAEVEKLKNTLRASLAKLDALFASLQHRAFRGEL